MSTWYVGNSHLFYYHLLSYQEDDDHQNRMYYKTQSIKEPVYPAFRNFSSSTTKNLPSKNFKWCVASQKHYHHRIKKELDESIIKNEFITAKDVNANELL